MVTKDLTAKLLSTVQVVPKTVNYVQIVLIAGNVMLDGKNLMIVLILALQKLIVQVLYLIVKYVKLQRNVILTTVRQDIKEISVILKLIVLIMYPTVIYVLTQITAKLVP